MTAFTTFGIIDSEIRGFIDKVCTQKPIDKERFTAWLYSEGVVLFSETQAVQYGRDMQSCEKQHGHRPAVTMAYNIGLKLIGYIAVLPGMISAFGSDDPETGNYITDQYNLLISRIIENHLPFYNLQAQAMTEINAFLDENPDLPKHSILGIVQERFLAYKANNPELSQQIDAHIQLMNEFQAHLSPP